MNSEVLVLANNGLKNAKEIYKEMEDIRITLINIRISVAKLTHDSEANALSVVADHIEKSLIELESKIKSSEKNYEAMIKVMGD